MITLLFLSFSWLKVLAWVGGVLFLLGFLVMILALLLFAGLKILGATEEDVHTLLDPPFIPERPEEIEEIDVNAPQYDDEEEDS